MIGKGHERCGERERTGEHLRQWNEPVICLREPSIGQRYVASAAEGTFSAVSFALGAVTEILNPQARDFMLFFVAYSTSLNAC
jgi:hypothetical protein